MTRISFRSDILQITYKSDTIKLLPKEYELFQLLYQHPSRVFSRQTLLDLLWPMADPVDRTVDDHIYRLRKKLVLLSDVITIRTVRGHGYVLDEVMQAESNALSNDEELTDSIGKLFRKYHLYGQGEALRLMEDNQAVFGVRLDAPSQLYLQFMNGEFKRLLFDEQIDFWGKCYYLLHLHFYADQDAEKSLSYFTKALQCEHIPSQHKLEIELLNRLTLLILTKQLDEAANLLIKAKQGIVEGNMEGFVLIVYLMELGLALLQRNEAEIESARVTMEDALTKHPFSREKALFSIMQGLYHLYKDDSVRGQSYITEGFIQFRQAKYVPGIFQSLKVIIAFLEESDKYSALHTHYFNQLNHYKEMYQLTELVPFITRELEMHL